MKLFLSYVYNGWGRILVYVGFRDICSFCHPLGVLGKGAGSACFSPFHIASTLNPCIRLQFGPVWIQTELSLEDNAFQFLTSVCWLGIFISSYSESCCAKYRVGLPEINVEMETGLFLNKDGGQVAPCFARAC